MIIKDNGEIIRCDEDTGEVMEIYTVPYKHPDVEYKEPYDKTKVKCKQDVVDYFEDEVNNKTIKVRWTNWAIEDLLDIEHRTANHFKSLSRKIISRNIVFERSEDLCHIMGIHKTDLSKTLRSMFESGLLREFKGHSGKRGWRYLELNPTIVFKTYQQNGGDSNYSSSTRFNSLHEHYIDQWVLEFISTNT